ncbi:VanZ family protein [Microbacterium sp. MYb66]|uniref:VanZ family protein n=1 Tax=Microbacterium sp. MYb66 TaxID=1848692 RepID=UPI0015E2B1F6|nr:VanZ family protein [Microbacterium sp. MYb66]
MNTRRHTAPPAHRAVSRVLSALGSMRGQLYVTALVYLAAIGWLTLGPQPLSPGTSGALMNALDTAPVGGLALYDLLEFAANVAMFAPFGVLVAIRFPRAHILVQLASGALLSTAIETAQFFVPGRVSDVRDIVANAGGAAIGVLVVTGLRLGPAFHRALAPRSSSA